ncbi:hypothetical protein [Peptostreptococcus sp. D1]|uniref:hypothetical protein n=1 Tax=Peptostreptococcus sp. D1 TaxID=72304 RepID=UPI0008EB3334|nr:hypothetical protein [Peptostreptococcus sp. D1]SFE84036.1 hypothetical protein SAMN02910278_01841 [Peptostreptococcus sp. D1]
MVDKILKSAGFAKNKTYKETRFIKPPTSTYVVYHDNYDRQGADDVPVLKYHVVTFELYEPTIDSEVIEKLEKTLDDSYQYMVDGWKKEERYWIDSENIYQTIYTFEYYDKRGE